jgi:hypothetical protein
MAKVTFTLEDSDVGVSLGICHDHAKNARELVRMTPAQQLAQQLQTLAALELKFDSLPAHCKHISNTMH